MISLDREVRHWRHTVVCGHKLMGSWRTDLAGVDDGQEAAGILAVSLRASHADLIRIGS